VAEDNIKFAERERKRARDRECGRIPATLLRERVRDKRETDIG
jgi:hypothetical protein